MERSELKILAAGVMIGLAAGFLIGRSVFTQGAAASGAGMAAVPMSGPAAPGAGGPGAGGPGAAPDPAQQAQAEQLHKEIDALRQRITADPKDREARVLLGNITFDNGLFDVAVKYYEEALTLDGNDPNVITDLGIAYRNLGQSAKAIEQFERAVALKADHAQGWFNIAVVKHWDLKDTDGARAAVEKVKGIDPAFRGLAELEKSISGGA